MAIQLPRALARLGLPLLLVATTAAQDELPARVDPVNAEPIVYLPPERLATGAAAPEHYVNVFLPLGTPPAAGWPVVIGTVFGGGVSTPPSRIIGRVGVTAPFHDLLDRGVAVVSYGVPGTGPNRGLYYPPGHPSGRYESFLPEDDNPEKAAIWAVQWTKTQTDYPFDLDNIGMRGSSGGAVLAVRTAMGPNRARATGSLHIRTETRIKAVLAYQPPTSVYALVQTADLTLSLPSRLEQLGRTGVSASTLDEVDPALQKEFSLMHVAFDSPEALANNATQRVGIVYGDPVLRVNDEVASFALDAQGFPVLHDAIKQPYQHDSWYGYAFFKRLVELSPQAAAFHAQSSMFAMASVNALPPPLDYHTDTYTGAFNEAEAVALGNDWIVAQLTGMDEPPPPPPTAGPLADASFEAQAPGGAPAEPWETFGTGTQVLTSATTTETGMPSDGGHWLELTTDGTAGTTPAGGGQGVRQSFLFDPLLPWLQFEAAFLPGELASAARNDWMSVDLSDGAQSVNLYAADTFVPLPMTSLRTSGAMSAVRTLTFDLRTLFPGADDETVLTLSIEVGNGGDGSTPSLGYLDGLRLRDRVLIEPYGCGVNPSGSLLVLDGEPILGTTMTLGVDNPLGGQAPGALPVIVMSDVPANGFPCGIQRPGFGMDGGVGELLTVPSRLLQPLAFGLPWTGPGNPASVALPVPADTALVGLKAYAQGLLYDTTATSSRIRLAEALMLTLAP